MKAKEAPKQLHLPLEYSNKQHGYDQEISISEQQEAKRALVLHFNSFSRRSEELKEAEEKRILLNAAQKLKW